MSTANEPQFEILPAAELRKKYGLTADNRPVIKLDAKRVPPGLRALIPLAEVWGISDDLIREDLISKAPREAGIQLKWAVSKFDDELDAWLAGPEAHRAPSREYIAFSAMRMAADSI